MKTVQVWADLYSCYSSCPSSVRSSQQYPTQEHTLPRNCPDSCLKMEDEATLALRYLAEHALWGVSTTPHTEKRKGYLQYDHGWQPCVTQWSCEPCHTGPPKMDGSWWRVLTKCNVLEKGMANHFDILASKTPLWSQSCENMGAIKMLKLWPRGRILSDVHFTILSL